MKNGGRPGWRKHPREHAMASRGIGSKAVMMGARGMKAFEIDEEPYERALDSYGESIFRRIVEIDHLVLEASAEYEEGDEDDEDVGYSDVKCKLTDSQIAKKVGIKNVNKYVVKAIMEAKSRELDWYEILEIPESERTPIPQPERKRRRVRR